MGIAIKTILYKTSTNIYSAQNSKYLMHNIDSRSDSSLCMRVCKEIIIKKTMKEKENKKKLKANIDSENLLLN